MLEILQFEFMRNALFTGLLAGITCGVIGSLVIVNRIVFISGGIAHAAYGGIGIAVFFGLPYLLGVVGFSILCAIVMALVTLKEKHRADTIIGVIWALGMALGVILLDLTPGYNVDLMSYLFGSILTVPKSELWMISGVTVLTVAVVSVFYLDFQAMAYDEEFSRLKGVPVNFLYCLLLCLIALCVVTLIRIVGLILVIALLTIPPYIAEKYAGSLKTTMIWAAVLSTLFTWAGLWLSYTLNLTSGATIILVGGCCFFISLFTDKLLVRLRENAQKSDKAA